jgi:hypothetical protein
LRQNEYSNSKEIELDIERNKEIESFKAAKLETINQLWKTITA